ncbi:MAG: type II toxin-antitoxin system VapC family toxin [Desulfococcaceae bacterium]
MKYLPDTCLISELTKAVPNQKVADWLKTVPPESLFISVITIGEIRKGLTKLPPSEKLERLTEWLNTLLLLYAERILPVDVSVVEKWGILQGNAEKKGKPMSSLDSLIGAAAMLYHLTVVTRNENDFDADNIAVMNQWKE